MRGMEDVNSMIQDMSEEDAVEWIMESYGEEIKRLIYTYVKNFSTTDDLFQDVMLIVYKKMNTFEGKSALKTWLYRITVNKCKDYLRSPSHRILHWKDHMLEKKDNRTPETSVLQDEWKNQLIEGVMNLPIKYREVLILQYYKELTIQEMSELLNENPSTIRTRIMRAKQKLKAQLEEVFIVETE